MEPLLDLRDKDQNIPIKTSPESGLKNIQKNNILEWNIETVDYGKRKIKLFIISGILATIGILLIFIWSELLLGIFLILASGMVIITTSKDTEARHVLIESSGITVNETRYKFRDLKSFWILYDPSGLKELSIEPKSWYEPNLRIMIDKLNPLEIREFLIQYLPEHKKPISILESLMRKLGI